MPALVNPFGTELPPCCDYANVVLRMLGYFEASAWRDFANDYNRITSPQTFCPYPGVKEALAIQITQTTSETNLYVATYVAAWVGWSGNKQQLAAYIMEGLDSLDPVPTMRARWINLVVSCQ